MQLKILKAWYGRIDPQPMLFLKLEGFEPRAIISPEAFLHLRQRQWGVVHLGSKFANLLPEIEREGVTLRGFTDDEEVVALAEMFLDAIEKGGNFKDGLVLIDENKRQSERKERYAARFPKAGRGGEAGAEEDR